MSLTRVDAQRLAQEKLDDARLLADHQRYSTAYYLAGYAVEIALKAAVARSIVAETIPAKGTIDRVYTHDFSRLVTIAGLDASLRRASADEDFLANWNTVGRWSPESRYAIVNSYACAALIDAIVRPGSGVFEWLRKHW